MLIQSYIVGGKPDWIFSLSSVYGTKFILETKFVLEVKSHYVYITSTLPAQFQTVQFCYVFTVLCSKSLEL